MDLTFALGVELLNVAGESLTLFEEFCGKLEGALLAALAGDVCPPSELSSPARARRSASISMVTVVSDRLILVKGTLKTKPAPFLDCTQLI